MLSGLIVPLDAQIKLEETYTLQMKLTEYEDGSYVKNDKQIAIDFMVKLQSH